MKFVIRSLLLVNLLLQLTGALRKCFERDESLMLTVVLLAFSVIGLLGLTLSNRFILIIFAACTTLILMASITIHVIGRSEPDEARPKVPRYLSLGGAAPGDSEPSDSDTLPNSISAPTSNRRRHHHQHHRLPGNRSRPLVMSAPLVNSDDYPSEEAPSLGAPVALLRGDPALRRKTPAEEPLDAATGGSEQVLSPEWLLYEQLQERRQERIVSQSIDLLLQTLLAFWLALLLDDDADTCFGTSGGGGGAAGSGSSARSNSGSSAGSSHATQANNGTLPVYNYNGVRYSIRPDSARDSPARPSTIYR